MPDDSGPVLFDRIDQHVALVTINRPEVRNAINVAAALDIANAVARVEAEDFRAAILSSTGRQSFSAGGDLTDIAAGRGQDMIFEPAGFAGLARAPRTKPWIAAVEGLAFGGGLELALACDMIVASEQARFGLPEVRRGFIAAGGGLLRLPRAIPRAIALEMIVTGEPIDAHRAHALGLVNHVVPEGQTLDFARTIAVRIAACAPLAVGESLLLARRAANEDEASLWRAIEAASDRLAKSDDAREGSRAFQEKRTPRWLGR